MGDIAFIYYKGSTKSGKSRHLEDLHSTSCPTPLKFLEIVSQSFSKVYFLGIEEEVGRMR